MSSSARRSRSRCWRLTAAALLLALPASANDLTQAADEHFQRGLAAAGGGKMTLAASEFERAYDAAPHYSVLYNLGLVYLALDRNADAVRVLRRYLAEGGENVSGSRRKQVEAIVHERSQSLAHATVRVQPEDAAVMIGARALEGAELSAPVELDPGRHLLFAQREGHAPSVRAIDVVPGEAVTIDITLDPVPAGGTSASQTVALLVDCATPEVELSIDGELVRPATAGAPLVVTAGEHRVRFTRPGYRSDERALEIREGERVKCRMRPLSPLPRSLGADLQVAAPPGARVFVDGEPFTGGLVPYGLHRVVVQHRDFVTWQREVQVPKGGTTRLEPDLVATLEHRLEEESITERKTWAIVSAATGLGLTATGVVLYVLNGRRYDEWESDNAAFGRNRDASSAELKRDAANLRQRATEIQRLDDIALGVGALGVASLSVGVGLFLTLPSSKREGKPGRVALDGLRGLRFETDW